MERIFFTIFEMSFLKHILWFWVNLKVLFCNSYFTATEPCPLDPAIPALRELKITMELEQVMVYNFELNHALSLVRSEVLNLPLYSPSCSYIVIFLYLSSKFKHGAVDTVPSVISVIRASHKSTTRVDMTRLCDCFLQNFRRICGIFSFLFHVDFLLIGFCDFPKRWPHYKIALLTLQKEPIWIVTFVQATFPFGTGIWHLNFSTPYK
jgi:hypothetical protein